MRRNWRLHQPADGLVRMRWTRDDGIWLEIRDERTGPGCWLVDGTGLHLRFASFGAALDAAYHRQAQLDGFGLA